MRLTGKTCLVLGGATGLLGQALVASLEQRQAIILAPPRQELDVTDEAAVALYLDENKPQIVFNTVAYTAVDLAEDEIDEATRLNATLPTMLGRLCAKRGIILVHYSTDFVFSGCQEMPFTEQDPLRPIQCMAAPSWKVSKVFWPLTWTTCSSSAPRGSLALEK